MKATVFFIPRQGGAQQQREVQISKEHFGEGFYATGDKWGCGKVARTPQGAVRMLVQDMATIIEIRLEGAHAPLL